ncbi:MAG: hypothetical protein K8E66_12895, partial [Phycisphaerales bacterium]|nr:hypothetical protein [Phycisphaerales bacterium]
MSLRRLIAVSSASVLCPLVVRAKCEWVRIGTPNPADEINVITDCDGGGASLHALLIADESFQQGNPVYPHALRRDADGWTDLG